MRLHPIDGIIDLSGLPKNPDSHQQAVRLEQLKLLFRLAIPGFVATLLNATLLLSILGRVLPQPWIFAWYAGILILTGARAGLVLRFWRQPESALDIQSWQRRFLLGALLAGTLWGLLPLLTYSTPFTYQLIVAFVIAGMTAGAAPILSAVWRVYLAFLLPAILPLVLVLIHDGMTGHAFGFSLAAMTLLYLYIIMGAGRAMERLLLESLQIRFANQALIASLETTKDSLQISNAALASANQELEAFSYSVSHDLRAPLRAIDGFSHILQEDFNQQLNAEGKQHLTRIRSAAQRMDALIQAMLSLSRIHRSELHRSRIDLSEMAFSIMEELRQRQPERKLSVIIHPALTAHADPDLMRIALTNLLENAWKFTRRRSDGRIEFGSKKLDGKRVFYVRDDGAGFDMAYADKLFTPFQRLHGAQDYEGTGIGLATVARIIHRHGGHIWAESAPGEGATFYFALTP